MAPCLPSLTKVHENGIGVKRSRRRFGLRCLGPLGDPPLGAERSSNGDRGPGCGDHREATERRPRMHPWRCSDEKILQLAGAGSSWILFCVSLDQVGEVVKVIEHVGGKVPVFARTFEIAAAEKIEAAGGIPILNSSAAADRFMNWFQIHHAGRDAGRDTGRDAQSSGGAIKAAGREFFVGKKSPTTFKVPLFLLLSLPEK